MNPFVMVIFGATGDLVKKKLIPALFSLFKQNKLPQQFYIVGFARREYTAQDFANYFPDFTSDPQWQEFTQHILYQQGMFEDPVGYQKLIAQLGTIEKDINGIFTRIFYLATPPEYYPAILDNLVASQLSDGENIEEKYNTRIVVEKPFGKDLETAKMLDAKLSQIFAEEQIFRVDHYLGKETVQNLLVFRFANSIFEPVWNKQFIDHIQITWLEESGVSGRGNFFDGVGMLRDVGQNHLMQLFASVAMEMPTSFSREAVRDARTKAIQAIACIDPKTVSENVVRGQYEGYKQESMVAPDSQTDTFIALKFFVNNPRFEGVPFYMRAGKAVEKNSVSISLVFKQTCHLLFREVGCPEEGNVLTINIQPDEGIMFHIIAKTPGTKLALANVNMHFNYNEQFGTQGTDAYQRLLLDILIGDQMLFNRSDELDSSWKFITNVLQGWTQYNAPLFTYEKGTNGPKEANDLIEKDGRKWI